MELEKKIIGKNNYIAHIHQNTIWPSFDEIRKSWLDNQFHFPKSTAITEKGFRLAQLGALYAIKSYWTVEKMAGTIVMPTGTGKTEVMLATVVSECCKRTLVIVPSRLLREQTVNRFLSLNILREIKAINISFENPVVGCINASPKDINELKELVCSSNVIVTTMSMLNSHKFKEEYLQCLVSNCDTLIIDEAHHVASKSWSKVKEVFASVRCLQFTATPFRNDGKKIDGDIIYNYPLKLAQENGYFKPINFYPVYEFDNDRKDLSVAEKAVELLEMDEQNGYPHLLLVRASDQKRARYLFNNIYNKYYSKYNPVVIISDNSSMHNKVELDKLRNGTSKIVVCVDMFSEGIDVPELKICAIHDKYKSLPITIQFIGRFARTRDDLGEASVVANVIDDDIKESLEELYSQDADWNKILKTVSGEKIRREINLQNLTKGFTGTEFIPLNQIRPKVSMVMYRTKEKHWHWKRWEKLFDIERSRHYVNEQEKILIITELSSDKVDWTTCKDLQNTNWNIHIVYWNELQKVFFINTTDKGLSDQLAKTIFDSCNRVTGENVFRCLYGINRLMLSTVGLKTAISHQHIRYRMFAGVDVGEGINNAVRGTSIKSNIFGVGYENGESVSIGCSYKGTIWAKWVETIDYWKDWCDDQANKILNSNISTTEILKGALVPEIITARPNVVPYRIDFPMELDLNAKGITIVKTNICETMLYDLDIRLLTFDENSEINFWIGNDDFQEVFSLEINENNAKIHHKRGSSISLCFNRQREISIKDYLNDNFPKIWFVDGSSLEGNYLVKLKQEHSILFSEEQIITWNWSGTDITKESQKISKRIDSIQYKVISFLKGTEKYSLIFDDDGSGEIADIIAIQEDDDKLIFELYHCKYSSELQPGARVKDLYEVCGQAEKCIKWTFDAKSLLERIMKREAYRLNKSNVSRYEIGDNKVVYRLINKLKAFPFEVKVYVVQPGVIKQQITSEMHQVLCSAAAYLQETRGIKLTLICS